MVRNYFPLYLICLLFWSKLLPTSHNQSSAAAAALPPWGCPHHSTRALTPWARLPCCPFKGTSHPSAAEHTLFSRARRNFSRIDYMLGHKKFSKFRKTKMISAMFSDRNGMKLQINNKRKVRVSTNMWKLNNTFLSNHWIKQK